MNHSSPRMALKLVDQPAPPALNAFCARCGAPPTARAPGAGAWRESRVCGHCGLGLVLRTPLAVSRESPLLVLDRALSISAMSLSAEELLGSSEQRAIGLAVDRLLVAADRPERFKALLQDAVLGGVEPVGVRCLIGANPDRPLRTRLGPCGPPAGALLLLDPASD